MKTIHARRIIIGGVIVAALVILTLLIFLALLFPAGRAEAAYRFGRFRARPPVHIYRAAAATPRGITPAEIKSAYRLPTTGGRGTIAIIDAYDAPSIEKDLAVFDAAYRLPACTIKNGCLEKHRMASLISTNSGWALEMSLDVEWAHAIAPGAKILLVEAKTPSGQNLLDAIDYARKRKDVIAISMSWGGAEFSDEADYDGHFAASAGKVAFFASSGDGGTGVSWPASSPYVIGVGGTSLRFSPSGVVANETAWAGSGGGVSAYEKQPAYQAAYRIARAAGMRAVPDVAYNADPASGFGVYMTSGTKRPKGAWYVVGGTSAGAPQWAAIQALGRAVSLPALYADKASSAADSYFRDITSGANGGCGYYCSARRRYDYVTGLGAPQTVRF